MANPDPTTGDDAALLEIVRQRSFRKGTFRLSSGAESNLYFNMKPTMMNPRGAYLSARAFLTRVRQEKADWVGGLEMGAVPVIASLAAISEAEGHPVRTFFVRKAAKDHGTMDLVEGLGPGETLTGARVLVADDVATTGGAILKAVEVVRGRSRGRGRPGPGRPRGGRRRAPGRARHPADLGVQGPPVSLSRARRAGPDNPAGKILPGGGARAPWPHIRY